VPRLFKVAGPKGGTIIKRATGSRVASALPALVHRFKRVTVSNATPAPKPKPAPSSPQIRAAIVAWCKWAIANEPQIHYAQERPMPIKRAVRALPLTTDCSGFATLAYMYAGAPDPNGCGYNGQGYTGTMLARGRRINLRAANPGDLVVFGEGTGHHVVVLLESGASGDPLVASHGQERGPIALRFSEEAKAQPRFYTVLNYV
jgi:cell wall-associated NlpC family hydrolase